MDGNILVRVGLELYDGQLQFIRGPLFRILTRSVGPEEAAARIRAGDHSFLEYRDCAEHSMGRASFTARLLNPMMVAFQP